MRKFILFITLLFLFINVKAIEIDSKHAIVYSVDTNQIIYEKNIDDEIAVASLTKIMTAIIIIENNDDLSKKVTIKDEDLRDMYEYATAGFQAGDVVTLEEILYGIILPSGSDAVNAGVRVTTTTEEEFVDLMNEKALELSLSHTHFSNPVGKDDNNYSTVYDMTKILEYALENEKFYKIFNTHKYNVKSLDIQISGPFYTSSKHYDIDYSNITGAKAGFTNKAQYCMASFNEENNIIVVNANALEYIESIEDPINIYNYVFDNYGYIDYNISFNLDIDNSKMKKYSVILNEKLYLPKNYDEEKITYKYDGIKNIDYRIKKGNKIGSVKIYYENNILKEVNVYLNKKIEYHAHAYTGLVLSIIIPIILFITILVIFIKINIKIKHKKYENQNKLVVNEILKKENMIEKRIKILRSTLDIKIFYDNLYYIDNINTKKRLEMDFIDRCFSNMDYTNVEELKNLNTKFKLYRNSISMEAYEHYMKTMKYCIKNLK